METSLTSFAVSFWMKPSNLTGTKMIFDEGGATFGLAVYLVDNQLNFSTRQNNVQIDAGDHTVPNDNAWHYVVAVFQNNELSLYLDGNKGTTVPAGYANGKISLHTGNGGIGYSDGGSGHGFGSGLYYAGLLDGFRYYNNQSFAESQLADLARNDGNRTGLFGGQNYTVTIKQADGKCSTSTDIPVGSTCPEICGNGIDDDGDGTIDNGCPTTPEICDNGIDDDGDGTIDNADTDCPTTDCSTEAYAIAATGSTRSGAANNATGEPNGTTTEIGANNDFLVLTLPDELSIGTDYVIHISGRGNAATSNVWEAPTGTNIPTSESNSPNGFTQNGQAIGPKDNIVPVTKTTQVPTKYLYFHRGSGDIEIDAVTVSIPCPPENCTDGIDNDGDGLIDCADGDCGTPVIQGVTTANPANCPALTDGKITIFAAGNNLEFSINGGTTYQSDHLFTGLTGGNYTIKVRNAATGCVIDHSSTITLTNPPCVEICNNNIDDDGDGQVDCNDGDCGTPTIDTVDLMNPDCTTLDGAQITINATGTDLEYSIDNGITFQTSNQFSTLGLGSYDIVVRNSTTQCEAVYTNNPVVVDHSHCPELCNNGMDDDGDGLIDCEDDDCQSNAISITPTTTADCTQDGSGAIELQVNGGMTPYSYQWADIACLLYTSPSPRDATLSRMPSSA